MFKLFIRRNWPTIIIIIAWSILTRVSSYEADFHWIFDINIWLNAVITELFIFNIMSCVTYKIKNQYWQNLISLITSLLISETIKYNFYEPNFSYINLLSIIIYIFIFTCGGYLSFSHGVQKGLKNNEKNKSEIKKQIIKMSNEEYDNLIKDLQRSITFMKKYKYATTLIKENDIDKLELSLKEFKNIRKYQ